MPRPLLIVLPLVLSLIACTTPAAPPMSDPMPPTAATCNAKLAEPAALGRQATPEVVEQAREDAGAKMARVLKPGQMVTMEYLEGRLNVDVDDDNVIIKLRCG